MTLGRYEEGSKEVTKINEDYKRVDSYPLAQSGYVITVKDLGLQVGWRTVFIIEYMGPIIIFPINYYLASKRYELSNIQM